MFKAGFEKNLHIEPLAETYITSLCSHYPDHAYEVKNGLLSQWRAYGGAERYCIVFDTEKLIKLDTSKNLAILAGS
jgi:hypothetical protein